MNTFLAASSNCSQLGFGIQDIIAFIATYALGIASCVFSVLFLFKIWNACTALADSARAHEKSAKAHQDTVYLLREIATLLKSNKENKQP